MEAKGIEQKGSIKKTIETLFSVYSFADEKLPVFKENRSLNYISYGEKNDYPETLITFYNRSPKHNAILTHKAKFITGKETIIEGGSKKILLNFNKYDSVEAVKYKWALDKKLFGAIAIEVVYDRELNPKFYHIPLSKIRTLDHTVYQYWPQGSKTKRENIKYYAEFDPDNVYIDEDGLPEKQIWYLREYRADLDVYSLPEYIGAIQYINIDTRIPNFHLNNIASGFTAGTLLEIFKGEPTPEMARRADRAFKKETTGDDNGGKLIIQWNEPTEQGAKITPLTPNELDKQFLVLAEHVEQEIFTGHGVTSPMLLGVKTAGQLGGSTELATAYETFYNSYVEREQKWFDDLFTKMLGYMGVPGKIKTLKMEPLGQDYQGLFKAGLVTKQFAQENLGLPVEAIEDPAAKVIQKFNDELIDIYAQFGDPESDFESFDMDFMDKKEAHVLSAVSQGAKSVKEIAAQTDLDTDEVEEILKTLKSSNLIKMTGEAVSITQAGNNTIDTNKIGPLVMRYKYALDPTAPPLQPGGKSRPFCEKLIELGRVYSRDDINTLSSRLGYDVWRDRGGWYHNPEKDVNVPHCRHLWDSVILKRK